MSGSAGTTSERAASGAELGPGVRITRRLVKPERTRARPRAKVRPRICDLGGARRAHLPRPEEEPGEQAAPDPQTFKQSAKFGEAPSQQLREEIERFRS